MTKPILEIFFFCFLIFSKNHFQFLRKLRKNVCDHVCRKSFANFSSAKCFPVLFKTRASKTVETVDKLNSRDFLNVSMAKCSLNHSVFKSYFITRMVTSISSEAPKDHDMDKQIKWYKDQMFSSHNNEKKPQTYLT